MDFQRYMRAIRKSWWLILLLVIVGGSGAYAYSKAQTPIYASKLGFYVGSPNISDSSANSTNQFAQDRAASYAKLLSSQALADMVVDDGGIRADPVALTKKISGTAQLNTVFVDAVVTDPSPKRAKQIADVVATQFPILVSRLDNTTTAKPARGAAPADTVKISVVNMATVPRAPISPRTRLNELVGAGLGLVVGLLLAVLRELRDVSLSTADELNAVTGAPVIGIVPLDRDIAGSPLVIDRTAYSPRGEAMRQIRTNLTFTGAAVPAQVIVVTSSVAGEGKSITSANLALSLANSGKSVALVEADLRRPRLSEFMDVERSVGLTNCLAGQVELDDVLQRWGADGLVVLPSGTIPPNPAELLAGDRMRALLAELRRRFDVVLLDTPPVLPVTDAAVLATEADGAVLVFRCGKTRRWQIRSAVQSLRAVNGSVLGCVLNGKPVRRSERAGYASYYSTVPGQSAVGRSAPVKAPRQGRVPLLGRR